VLQLSNADATLAHHLVVLQQSNRVAISQHNGGSMGEAKLNVEALVAALDSKRRAKGLSWRQLAKRTGVGQSTLTRMQQGKRPDVDTFASLLQWLGMPAEDFLIAEGSKSKKASEPHPVAMLSAQLRAKKELSPKALQAVEELIQAAYKLGKEIK
jgi:transcriptional regulator with XRE-family HTH domain